MNKLFLACSVFKELGIQKLTLFALYKAGLRTGLYRVLTLPQEHSQILSVADLPEFVSQWLDLFPVDTASMLDKASNIVQNLTREDKTNFQNKEATLTFSEHWTRYETDQEKPNDVDIKHAWEPARFSWVFTLGRAYLLTQDESYPQLFWRKFEEFQRANLPYLGPNWMSAQEVSLRMLAFVFALQAFGSSPNSTPERIQQIARAISDHAHRIPPTLIYARSQNNNHLVSEAVALYTAALVLPDHPEALKWRMLGWRWFNWAVQHQVNPTGTYIQHSTNYHRMLLALAIWMRTLAKTQDQALPAKTMERLAAATRWLQALVDPQTGQVPNLGANDGANIMPADGSDYLDYRPIMHAACITFGARESEHPQAADMPRLENATSNAFLRVAHFTDRPSHADQLHLDLWWGSENILLDAGTFSYNAPPPWTNALSTTRVHNTLTLNFQDQMTWVSRFLWLNWAQAEVLDTITNETGQLVGITAQHDGYRRLGYTHRRSVTTFDDGRWVIDDRILPVGRSRKQKPVTMCLHWLLPDLPWSVQDHTLTLQSQRGIIKMSIRGSDGISLVRAGELLHGEAHPDPTMGWYSPNYDIKVPSLALLATKTTDSDLSFSTFLSLGW
jgi:hypothetical protein